MSTAYDDGLPVILMRASLAEQVELEAARMYFHVLENRSDVLRLHHRPDGQVVIPRYSALPYYQELEYDMTSCGLSLINTYAQHRYVADLQNWYYDFEDLTPKTWFRASDVPSTEEGPFILKGATNSRKHRWKEAMFAPTRADIGRVLSTLMDDPLISEQGVYVRKFEEFETYGEGLNGLPITDEWRYFILDGQIVGRGFYWSEHKDPYVQALATRIRDEDPMLVNDWLAEGNRDQFILRTIIPRLEGKIRFVVADVARSKGTNMWRLVELNDGQQSGLGCLDPDSLYGNMARVLKGKTLE